MQQVHVSACPTSLGTGHKPCEDLEDPGWSTDLVGIKQLNNDPRGTPEQEEREMCLDPQSIFLHRPLPLGWEKGRKFCILAAASLLA